MSKKTSRFKEDALVEVWGDVVAIKELLLSIVIAIVLGMSAYALAPDDSGSAQLLYAIGGIVVATIINSLLFKPKRIVQVKDSSAEVQQGGEDSWK